MKQHGDAKLTDLLQALADCRKAHSASIHERCKRSTSRGWRNRFGLQKQKIGVGEQTAS
jgi:hypothetical protein